MDSSYGKQDCRVEIGDQPLEDVNARIWYCVSDQGHRKGPFQMSGLKKYYDTSDHNVEIKVFKNGEKQEEAIPLRDAIRKLFSYSH